MTFTLYFERTPQLTHGKGADKLQVEGGIALWEGLCGHAFVVTYLTAAGGNGW